MVVPLSTLPAVGLAEGHESCAVLCGDGNRMRTAEDDLVPQPRMRRIGLAWFCRLTREPRRLARRYLLQGRMNPLSPVRAQLICYPGGPRRFAAKTAMRLSPRSRCCRPRKRPLGAGGAGIRAVCVSLIR